MFDKHNMRNFEPTEKQTAIYEKQSMNMDYLNYLNDYNKEQRKYIYLIKKTHMCYERQFFLVNRIH